LTGGGFRFSLPTTRRTESEVHVRRTFFIAGIIQGSLAEADIHRQDYRRRLRRLLRERFPDDEVYCPFEQHPDSIGYDDAQGRRTFHKLMRLAGEADVLVAYVPAASMGTAIELWRAHHGGAWVLTISALTTNWVVRFLSDRIFADLDEFERFVRSGRLAELISRSPPREAP
jgi:hypothetical protein